MNGQSGKNKVSLQSRLQQPGPRKLLAIDGGGIRGVLALEILKGIEQILRSASGNPDYRLADYFDYVAGTSTGGIVAAGIAVGMSIDGILDFYEESGADMFQKARLHRRLRYKYESEPLAEKLKAVFGADTNADGPGPSFGPKRHLRSEPPELQQITATDPLNSWPLRYTDCCNSQVPLHSAAPGRLSLGCVAVKEARFAILVCGQQPSLARSPQLQRLWTQAAVVWLQRNPAPAGSQIDQKKLLHFRSVLVAPVEAAPPIQRHLPFDS